MHRILSLMAFISVSLSTAACNGEREDTSVEEDDTDTGEDPSSTIVKMQTGIYTDGAAVSVEGAIVTSPDTGDGFFIQDTSGDDFSGIWVTYRGVGEWDAGAGVNIGDAVTISGTYTESTDANTEGALVIAAEADLTVNSSGNALPPIKTLTDADWADDVALEPYEGMLVRVTDVVVREELDDNSWGWEQNIITSDLFYAPDVSVGGSADVITGNLSSAANTFTMTPHDEASIQNYADPPCVAEKCAADLLPGDLVITELMYDPDVGEDATNQWIELYNATGSSVDLNGLTIADNDSDTFTIDEQLIMSSGGYIVLASSGGWDYDFTPDRFGDIPVFDIGQETAVVYYDGGSDVTTIDEIPLITTSTIRPGRSLQLSNTHLDSVSNDQLGRWCYGISFIGESEDRGTPGTENDRCSPKATGDE
ncbi:MAG: lamin tail domain-containing protein [Myxococcota bacterium]